VDPGTGKDPRSNRGDGPWNEAILEVLESGEHVIQRRGMERGRKSTFKGRMVEPNLIIAGRKLSKPVGAPIVNARPTGPKRG
jgi:hypothetical protein